MARHNDRKMQKKLNTKQAILICMIATPITLNYEPYRPNHIAHQHIRAGTQKVNKANGWSTCSNN